VTSLRRPGALRLILAAFALAAPAALRAQAVDPGVAPEPPTAATGPVIDTIVVDRRNVFGPEPTTPAFIGRVADALHIETRERIIRRHLFLSRGEPYDSAGVQEAARRLRALGIFRDVQVDTGRVHGPDGGRLALNVHTADGWSTKPEFDYRSSGGASTWSATLIEENFLGTATQLNAGYRETPDRSSWSFGYHNPGATKARAVIDLQYAELSDGRTGAWAFGVPFQTSSSRAALVVGGYAGRDRVLVYRGGALDATWDRRTLVVDVQAGLALRADSRAWTRVWLRAVGGRRDFAPEGQPVPRTDFAAVGVGLDFARPRYVVARHVNSYARHEDLDLTSRLRFGLWAAPRPWGYSGTHAGAGPEISARWGAGGGNALIALNAAGYGIVSGGRVDSGRVSGEVTGLVRPSARHVIIVQAAAALAHHPAPGGEYDLWGARVGPRLFGAHAATGDRAAWGSVEDRVLVAEQAFGLVGLGLAPFLDWGGAWFRGDPSRLGGDVGLALRIGPTRSARGDVIEIAGGWRWGPLFGSQHWALSIGTALWILGGS